MLRGNLALVPRAVLVGTIFSLSGLESLPSVMDLLAPRAPPEVTGPPPQPETVAPPAAVIIEAPPAARPNPATNMVHKRQTSETIPWNDRIARQARPEPAEGYAWKDCQGGAEGGTAVGTAVRRGGRPRKPKSAVEGRNWWPNRCD